MLKGQTGHREDTKKGKGGHGGRPYFHPVRSLSRACGAIVWPTGKEEVELLPDPRGPCRVGLDAVPRSPIHIDLSLDHILEVMFESRQRDDLEDATNGIAGIPERMPLVAWLEHQIARSCVHNLVVQARAKPALENKAVLVLT